MAYLIRESTQEDKDLIFDFNKELQDHRINFRLKKPTQQNYNSDDLIYEREFVLTENKKNVKAGYTLKSQSFKINNEISQIGYYYNPVTAGLYDKKYNICGVLLLNDALKKYPNLFCLGMGSYSEPLPKLLKAYKWKFKKIPFFFQICNPQAFLENCNYLKNTKIKSFIVDMFKNTGLGWIIIKIVFKLKSLLLFNFSKFPNVESKEAIRFTNDVDPIWEEVKKYNTFCAVRNSKYLNQLYSDQKFIKLKFVSSGKIVGWTISLCTKLNNHKQFGSMKLGSIIDCLSLKGYEKILINKTLKILKEKSSDLIISNQSHIFWKKAFKFNSFINGPSNFIFAYSQSLTNKLNSNKNLKDFIHVTRADGDGPINL